MFSAARCLLVVDECTQCSITVTFKGPSTFFSLGSHLHFLSMELHARFLLTVSGQSFLATKKCLMFRTILRIQKNGEEFAASVLLHRDKLQMHDKAFAVNLKNESSASEKVHPAIWAHRAVSLLHLHSFADLETFAATTRWIKLSQNSKNNGETLVANLVRPMRKSCANVQMCKSCANVSPAKYSCSCCQCCSWAVLCLSSIYR